MEERDYIKQSNVSKISLWKDKTPLLGKLDIELTERCNNSCVHCYINLPADDSRAKEKELSSDEIKEILKEAVSLGCLNVKFTGGEPLLRDDFEEIYIFARKLGLRVIVFTNAALITPHLAGLFSRTPPLRKIEITVYGIKEESYESVTRTPGSFNAAFQGINLLLENKVPFVVKGALLPQNRNEIDEFERWAENIPWMESPASYAMFFDLRCRRDSEAKNELIKRLRLSPEEGLQIFARNSERYVKGMREFCSKFTRPPGDKIFSCGSGVRGGCVDAYGNFQPCLLMRHPDAVYDLKNGSLKDALVNFFPGMREKKAVNPCYLARCANCFLKGLCEQCPAKSWMEHGTLDTPVEYLCGIAHIQARYLGLVKEDEKGWEIKDWRERIQGFCGKEVLFKSVQGEALDR